uniref:KH_dom_type_1 domain-containing protein n=1 Tax=Panagrellus redivivus TaxID=6233 RepID=A0A7E4W4F8_PANRE
MSCDTRCKFFNQAIGKEIGDRLAACQSASTIRLQNDRPGSGAKIRVLGPGSGAKIHVLGPGSGGSGAEDPKIRLRREDPERSLRNFENGFGYGAGGSVQAPEVTALVLISL